MTDLTELLTQAFRAGWNANVKISNHLAQYGNLTYERSGQHYLDEVLWQVEDLPPLLTNEIFDKITALGASAGVFDCLDQEHLAEDIEEQRLELLKEYNLIKEQ